MCVKILFITWIIILLSIGVISQPLSSPVGARAVAIGHCSVVSKDIWGVFNNPAALAFQTGMEFGLALENRFLLKEMNRITLGASAQLGHGALSAGIEHFGDQYYGEMKASAGYALQIGKQFSAGLQLNYLRMAIGDGYGNFQAFTFEGGLLAMISDKLSIGIHCFNPIHVKWIGTTEHIPLSFKGGFGFRPEKSIMICAEILKSTATAAVFSAGCEYRYRDKFIIRTGITSGPARITFGVGFKLKKLVIDIASSLHSYLGYSPQLSLIYTAKH